MPTINVQNVSNRHTYVISTTSKSTEQLNFAKNSRGRWPFIGIYPDTCLLIIPDRADDPTQIPGDYRVFCDVHLSAL